jgi:hypothetical protein
VDVDRRGANVSEPAPALDTPTETIPAVVDAPTEHTEPMSAIPPAVPDDTETVTCPECGTAAVVTLNRRESRDFCRTCDYPLFWTPSAVLRDTSTLTADDSLRRLPGTVGRATVASLRCPHCSEPNTLTAVTCIRCGQPMHPVAEPPPPEPVYIAPPPLPEPEPEPEHHVAWWVWALLALGAAATIVLIVLSAIGTFS